MRIAMEGITFPSRLVAVYQFPLQMAKLQNNDDCIVLVVLETV